MRIVALTKLVHGERHLKVAEAHARLAKGYFQLKGNCTTCADLMLDMNTENQLTFMLLSCVSAI